MEAGAEFSFHSAFAESCGLMSLLQIAGRASRSGGLGNRFFGYMAGVLPLLKAGQRGIEHH